MTPRTWAEQQAAEAETLNAMRREWLESLIAIDAPLTDIIECAGTDPRSFFRMCRRLGVKTRRKMGPYKPRADAAPQDDTIYTFAQLPVRMASQARYLVNELGITPTEALRRIACAEGVHV